MSETTEIQATISAICVHCGLCCDGTLFRHASLKDDDDLQLARTLGLSINEQKDDKQNFRQPCHHFNGCCTIYTQPRPKVCGPYYCHPMRLLKKGDLSQTEATELIQRATRLKQQFKREISNFPEFAHLSIAQIRPKLQVSDGTPQEQTQHRTHYGSLLLIGIKLFPLLDEIKKTISVGDRANTRPKHQSEPLNLNRTEAP
jgi:hypothetical protein